VCMRHMAARQWQGKREARIVQSARQPARHPPWPRGRLTDLGAGCQDVEVWAEIWAGHDDGRAATHGRQREHVLQAEQGHGQRLRGRDEPNRERS